MADKESLTGLTDAEAQEVHKYMVQGYIVFVAVAVVAHILVWNWRPWFAPVNGWKTGLIEAVPALATLIG
ncbi:MAG: light-harvesting antenna LH1, beta subunit [Beijerinckiaceae bacterium]